MAKLHELLAAEKDVKSKAAKVFNEARDTFGKKHDHFTGFTKTYHAFSEEEKYEEEALSDSKEIVTTVQNKLDFVLRHLVDSIDISYQKDLTNRNASADIIVDGNTIATDIPATTLLNLEDQIRSIRDLCNVIPTLTPGVKWIQDSTLGDGIYKTDVPDVKIRTRKETVYRTVAKATDKHPEQVASETKDVPIGKYVEEKLSGALTPAEKSRLIERIDKLLFAVKKARARANEATIVDSTIAEKLINFIKSS